MVTAVKHRDVRCIVNNSPFYVTTNAVQDLAEDTGNGRRRIVVFETQSLPWTVPGANKWIYDNAMECVAWMAAEIDRNIQDIDEDER